MLKYRIVLVGLFGLGFLCSALAEEAKATGKLISLSGEKTRGASNGYYFGPELVTWSEAKEFCQQAGKTLLVIENKLKQSAFEEAVDSSSMIQEMGGLAGLSWIAGTDKRSTTGGVGEKRFYWTAAGSERKNMTYWNFGDCNPANGCLTVSNEGLITRFGKWFVQACETKSTYFCETKG